MSSPTTGQDVPLRTVGNILAMAAAYFGPLASPDLDAGLEYYFLCNSGREFVARFILFVAQRSGKVASASAFRLAISRRLSFSCSKLRSVARSWMSNSAGVEFTSPA